MTVRAQIPGHMVPNLPAGDKEGSYKPVVLEDPPGPVGEKKKKNTGVSGWVNHRHIPGWVGDRSWAS